MARRGIPKGLTLLDGIEKPVRDKPIRSGDYLDEMMGEGRPKPVVPPRPQTETTVVPSPKPETETTLEGAHKTEAAPRRKGRHKTSSIGGRARPNISPEGQKRLAIIVDQMVHLGPEPNLHGGEVLEAAIMALYDARDYLDLNNVRRRGKYGSVAHKNFPVSIAESIKKAIAELERQEGG
ncbi:hypothetical protein [Engelhardtia mirabilis]|uniref:Uncharacterized protein n=1 Tax=Engelhardtia mirabilis TaxID=2528011 RepID=A0A518BT69_9BACT|nr:hypothetical protein Pla133_52970 [Planctomycetes bacterium Pla133]QDV04502.1 hypothetical protein Pla86_52980 [Planctomycetes bacterium Pla86]